MISFEFILINFFEMIKIKQNYVKLRKIFKNNNSSRKGVGVASSASLSTDPRSNSSYTEEPRGAREGQVGNWYFAKKLATGR